MTTSKITEINLDSFQGRVSTTDPAVIAQISDYLKHNLTATPSKDPETVDFPINPDTPGSLYGVEISSILASGTWGHGYGEYEREPLIPAARPIIFTAPTWARPSSTPFRKARLPSCVSSSLTSRRTHNSTERKKSRHISRAGIFLSGCLSRYASRNR